MNTPRYRPVTLQSDQLEGAVFGIASAGALVMAKGRLLVYPTKGERDEVMSRLEEEDYLASRQSDFLRKGE